MKIIPKLILLGLLGLFALFGAVWIGTGGWEDWQQERAIRFLIRSGASRDVVATKLPIYFTDYSVGAADRSGLDRSLRREPSTSQPRLRERVARNPGVWFHTTIWTQTWLFFDADGKLRDYYTCAQ